MIAATVLVLYVSVGYHPERYTGDNITSITDQVASLVADMEAADRLIPESQVDRVRWPNVFSDGYRSARPTIKRWRMLVPG